MLRSVLLSASRSDRLRQVATDAPPARAMVDRFVAGETTDDAVRATSGLVESGRLVTIDHLGEDTLDLEQAGRTRDAYLALLDALGDAGLTDNAEVSVKLSAVGQALPGDGEKIALENAHAIAEKASALGTTLTLDMEDHTTTDSTLGTLRELRAEFPSTGAVIQAYLHRSEALGLELGRAGPGGLRERGAHLRERDLERLGLVASELVLREALAPSAGRRHPRSSAAAVLPHVLAAGPPHAGVQLDQAVLVEGGELVLPGLGHEQPLGVGQSGQQSLVHGAPRRSESVAF